MEFKDNLYEQLNLLKSYYIQIEERKENILKFLKEIVYNVEPEVLEHVKPNPKYVFAKFSENFKTKKVKDLEGFDYSIMAVDGSRIGINEEFPIPFYVINTAVVFEKYGKDSQFKKETNAKIFFSIEEIFDEDTNLPIGIENINLQMLLEESKYLEEKLHLFKPDIAMFDGSLILWGLKKSKNKNEKDFIRVFESSINKARELQIPIVGYISNSRSKEVVKSLIIFAKERGINLRFDEQDIELVNDVDLMDKLLGDFEMSPIFTSTEPLISEYSNKIKFFFLKTTSEVVRVEVPEYVSSNDSSLEFALGAILDQIRSGGGYPLILKLAHFEAVLNDSDKKYIENLLLKDLGVRFQNNAKYLAKLKRKI